MNRFRKIAVTFSSIISICLCLAVSTTASAAINWWKVGWIVVSNAINPIVDIAVDLDGASYNNQYSAELISPSVLFNVDNTGRFYFQPEVDSRVTSFEMHAHRANPLDFGANITISLERPNGSVAVNKSVGTNQYISYTRKSGDVNGTWRAIYTENSMTNWQCYYRHYYGNARSSVRTYEFTDSEGLTIYTDPNINRVFRFREDPDSARPVGDAALTLNQLYDQFIDVSSGQSVDYLRDYDAGDMIDVAVIPQSIIYDSKEDCTSFAFPLNEELIEWKFDGDLTDSFDAGKVINFTFQVVSVGSYGNTNFESLDIIENSVAAVNNSKYPSIARYLC
ncbi:hypothetical protein [Bifidobacterium pullorum]|uniref:hypothetical protein n=1 Tax=Bifidobacterium pullorum TaxID=78448 RepID=UPI00242FCEB7|nr:hypothetical protein [Bifidobacterium pullorum]